MRKTDEPTGGWYHSPDKIESSAEAISNLQLPPESSAKYRLEFDYSDVKDNIVVSRGSHLQAEYFEPICKDYANFGSGGGKQIIIEGVDVAIKEIWDISSSLPVKLYP